VFDDGLRFVQLRFAVIVPHLSRATVTDFHKAGHHLLLHVQTLPPLAGHGAVGCPPFRMSKIRPRVA